MRIFWSLVGLAAVLLLFDTLFSYLSTCDPQSYPNPENQPYEKYCSAFKGPVITLSRAILVWAGHVLHDYGEAVIAIFTVVLAISTIALWKATRGLHQATLDLAKGTDAQIAVAKQAADAATLNAKAAIGMELPVIRANHFPGLVRVPARPSPDAPFRGGIHTQDPGELNVISGIDFQNHGRTPAFPSKLTAGWMVTDNLPSEPDYFHEINSSPTAMIKPDGEFNAAIRALVELTTEQRTALKEQSAFLWLYVSLHYRDFMNLPHEARFAWRFTHGRGFGTGGGPPPAYTSHS